MLTGTERKIACQLIYATNLRDTMEHHWTQMLAAMLAGGKWLELLQI